MIVPTLRTYERNEEGFSETADEVDVDGCLCAPTDGIVAGNGKRTAENGGEDQGSDVFVHRELGSPPRQVQRYGRPVGREQWPDGKAPGRWLPGWLRSEERR